MCGRTACSLGPERLCRACRYRGKDGKEKEPRWKESSSSFGSYKPKFNMSPQSYSPVLVSSAHFAGDEVSDEGAERVLVPMKWGLVPAWHKGDPGSVPYKMINARSESLMDKRSYSTPLSKGKRCVVVADGFFEWAKDKKGGKQPYFLYFPQPQAIDFSDPSSGFPLSEEKAMKKEDDDENSDQRSDEDDSRGGEPGRKLLTMAGVFEQWKSPEDPEDILFSYCIITVPSSSSLQFIHDRMPAILQSDQAIEDWLNFEEVSLPKALNLLNSYDELEYYPVGRDVGNVRIDGPDLVRPLDVKPEKSPQKTLDTFFKPKRTAKSAASPSRAKVAKQE